MPWWGWSLLTLTGLTLVSLGVVAITLFIVALTRSRASRGEEEKIMSKKTKGIISAILALLVAAFAWYSAYSDGDPETKPDNNSVIGASKDTYDAFQVDDDGDAATTTTVAPVTE